MPTKLTPQDDRECPIYAKVIDGELCYETAMCMQGLFKLTSLPEIADLEIPIDTARKICKGCKYADMED